MGDKEPEMTAEEENAILRQYTEYALERGVTREECAQISVFLDALLPAIVAGCGSAPNLSIVYQRHMDRWTIEVRLPE